MTIGLRSGGLLFGAGLTAAIMVVAPAFAQEQAETAAVENAAEAAVDIQDTPTDDVGSVAAVVPAAETDSARCELHVWPTENYLGINSGLLSGFGIVGALADMAAHEGKVKTVKDLMADYLGPVVQMEELNKLGVTETLKLKGYRVVLEEPTPFNEDAKNDPAVKAKIKLMNARIKAGQRLSDSKHGCYAELVTTHIFYHKAMMYGSNLFTGWTYREFGDKPIATKVAKGQVKNPLEDFPPKTEDKIEAAKLELRNAYSKDFVEYVQKKVMP